MRRFRGVIGFLSVLAGSGTNRRLCRFGRFGRVTPSGARLVSRRISLLLMSAPKLPNYLRAYRKRAGLSQADVSWLLGTRSGTKVSRYERWNRQASLRTAFAYEVIFGAPARELFAGTYHEVERATEKRIADLTRRLSATPANRATARKLAVLHGIHHVSADSAIHTP